MLEPPVEQPQFGIQSQELADLMDKIVAVQMDLKPLCAGDSAPGMHIPHIATVTRACEILGSAVDELRSVIQRLDQQM